LTKIKIGEGISILYTLVSPIGQESLQHLDFIAE